MKKKMFLIMSMLAAISLDAQVFQHTIIELDSAIPNDQSAVYVASTSIKLLAGFYCDPQKGNSATFSIDRYGVFPPEEGLTGGPASSYQDGVAGALPGELNISDLGAAVYSIPIMTPSGLGDMTPQLAVTYNSQAGNGLLGWGWNISGLSSITRAGQTEYHDDNQSVVNFVDDRFLMDGKRLMLCSGTYGGNGSVYKTEIDEMSKIVAFTDGYNGPARFVVYKKDGTMWEYGATADSRIEPQNMNNVALMWLVDKITDPDGNYMVFNYLENQSTGESYINSIDYTLNDEAGIGSMYRIRFVYEDRTDAENGFVYGNIVSNRKILKNIVISNLMSGTVLYDYSFDYLEPNNYVNDYKSMYYRLKSIGLEADGMKLNPTIVSWNKKSHYPDKFLSYPLSKSIFNKVPFVGDFNGDGFSDVITVPYKNGNAYPSNVQATIYLNKGDGTFNETAHYQFTFDTTLEWLYVVDFDGDGRDDVVPYYANYETNASWKSKFCVYLNHGDTFSCLGEYSTNRYFTIYPGDFFGDRKVGFFLEHNNAGYGSIYYPRIVYYENNMLNTQSLGVQSYSFVPERVFVEDFNGDGRSEIMYLMGSSSVVAKITRDGNGFTFFHLYADDNFDSDDFLFPGDFNGDGYTDLLQYDNKTYWRVAFSNGVGFQQPIPCINNNLLRNLTLAPIDRYFCSLKDLSVPTVTIRTVDFDGDGKTDVGVFKNTGGSHCLEVGLLMRENANNSCDFGDIRRFYLNINHSHKYIHIGNFLGHENASILGSVQSSPNANDIPKIVSLNPHSSKYSVERITDGMGNVHGFNYEYLMPKNNCDFYSFDYQWIDSELRTVALPIRALCSDTVFIDKKPCVAKYSYQNALYHTKGRGLQGFEIGVCNILINNLLQETTICDKDWQTANNYHIILPHSCVKYNSNNQIVSREDYSYNVYSCVQNEKVVMPLPTVKTTLIYDCDSPGTILKTNIQNIDYQSDATENNYSDIVNVARIVEGVDNKYSIETEFTYDCNPSEWIVSRIVTIRKSEYYEDEDAVGMCTALEYNGTNPYQVTKKTSLPNTTMNYADPLKIVSEYEYDAVGHVTKQSQTSPSERNQRVEEVHYDPEYNYRFPTTRINENGWDVTMSYNSNYGNLIATLDYNSFETASDSDPFEINKEVVLPDGTISFKAKRWARGNEHSPQDAVYYIWEKTTGNAEKMSFYNQTGRLLREVTFGLDGEAIYVDIQYDVKGNMTSKSMPYIAGDEVKSYYYVYDINDRLLEEVCPNGMVKSYSYNGLQRTITSVSSEGVSRVVVEIYNPMGWRMRTVDIGGNIIDYEYFSDGKLKSTTINGNSSTKVEYNYDGRRNLLRMNDSASGETLFDYNAYGELKMKRTARNCIFTYEYDALGQVIRREEIDHLGNVVVTQWNYDNKKGKLGTLSSVTYGDSHAISYDYDDLLRVSCATEMIRGKEYATHYLYDAANREEFVTYPSGVTIQKKYSNSGYYRTMAVPDDNLILWRSNKANAVGYVTDYQVGNGLKTRLSYDGESYMLNGILTESADKTYQDLSYCHDGFGNLINRTSNSGTKPSESFVYDGFNRLVGISLNDIMTGQMVYDEYGNIISKRIDGRDIFYEASYDGTCPYEVRKVKTNQNDLPGLKQNIVYAPFDKMTNISSENNSLSIEYGFDYERIRSFEIVGGKKKEKVYAGNCEYVDNDGVMTVYTYLYGPMGVFAVCCTDAKGDNSIVYIHKDNLESWCLITDEVANILQRTSYDAWGNPRNDKTWSGTYNGELLCDRGFTGHEHMEAFGIINMNGRAYDPLLSMMMSPDNYIQNPDFSQNYNRYSYCFNNPLTYYDPSGEWVEWLMYGVFNGVINMICNRDDINSFSEGLLSFSAGFVSGCLSNGLSECSWVLQVVGGVAGATFKSGINSLVKQNTGSGIDWSLVKTKTFKSDVMYALGSSLAKSVLNAYLVPPTDSDDGKSIGTMLCKERVNRRLLETASKRIVGNIFAGRNMFDGFNITKDNWEDAMPYVDCLVAIVGDNLEFETSSETLSDVSDKVLNFDFSGVASKLGSDVNYCYSQFRALFVKKGN